MKKIIMTALCSVGFLFFFGNTAYAEAKGTLIEEEAVEVKQVKFYLEKGAEEEYYATHAIDGEITQDINDMVEALASYVTYVNPNVPQSVIDMLPHYVLEGKREGIRGDIAFALSCLETGNFKFSGSAVTLEQNNFCGLGVTRNGEKGHSFDSPEIGIRAQIQHMKAYANKNPLVSECVDPRFRYVSRGSAPYVEWLGIQENPKNKGWASGVLYGQKILGILSGINQNVPDLAAEEDIQIMPDEPEREGLIFIGWMDEEHQFFTEDYEITDDLNLYAVWYIDGDIEE